MNSQRLSTQNAALPLADGRCLALDRPRIVGVLNLTPDSFSDGGLYTGVDRAVQHALEMVRQGADAIDIGGESTRPGAARVSADEQWRRIGPVVEKLAAQTDAPISIDTTRADVAERALDAGAAIVNDISAGREDARMFALAAQRGCPIILMHMLGEPAMMQKDPRYDDVVAEVRDFLMRRAAAAIEIGVDARRIVIDPGIGFGKTLRHNLALMANLKTFVDSGYPMMLGASRKSFLGRITGIDDPADRAAATAATTAIGVAAGVQLFRVHDVAVNRQAADVTFAVIGHRKTATDAP